MTPENQTWKYIYWLTYRLWKNKDEINVFLMSVESEIIEMMKSKDRAVNTGQQIQELHQILKSSFEFNQKAMADFITFLNLLGKNIYTRKTEVYLLFLEHCVPIDKCSIIE